MIHEALGGPYDDQVLVIARRVNKKDGEGAVEVMLMLSDEGVGISVALARDGAMEIDRGVGADEAVGKLARMAAACVLSDFQRSGRD